MIHKGIYCNYRIEIVRCFFYHLIMRSCLTVGRDCWNCLCVKIILCYLIREMKFIVVTLILERSFLWFYIIHTRKKKEEKSSQAKLILNNLKIYIYIYIYINNEIKYIETFLFFISFHFIFIFFFSYLERTFYTM